MSASGNDGRFTGNEDGTIHPPHDARTAQGHHNSSARTQGDYINSEMSTSIDTFSIFAPPSQKHIDSTHAHDTSIDPQPQSRLFRLPVELRLEIYEHLLRIPASAPAVAIMEDRSHTFAAVKTIQVILGTLTTVSNRARPDGRPSVLSILATCRRALHEAEEMFYSINRLTVEHPHDFLACLNSRRRSAMTTFTLLVSNAGLMLAGLKQLHKAVPNLTSLHILRKDDVTQQDHKEWEAMAPQLVAEIRKMGRLTEVKIRMPDANVFDNLHLYGKWRIDEVDARICGAVSGGA